MVEVSGWLCSVTQLSQTGVDRLRGRHGGPRVAMAMMPPSVDRCPTGTGGVEEPTSAEHGPEVAVVGEVDEEVDGRVEDLECVADVDEVELNLQRATPRVIINYTVISSLHSGVARSVVKYGDQGQSGQAAKTDSADSVF